MIEKAMSRDPENRFGSVHELGIALLEFASPRTQVLWGDEFRGSKPSTPPVASGPDASSAPNVTPQVSSRDVSLAHAATDVARQSTLRRSALELPIRGGQPASVSPPPARTMRAWIGASAVVIVATIATLGSKFIGSREHPAASPVRAATFDASASSPIDLPSPPRPAPSTEEEPRPARSQPEPPAPAATASRSHGLPPRRTSLATPPHASATTRTAAPTETAVTPAAPPTQPAAPPTPSRRGNNNAPIVD